LGESSIYPRMVLSRASEDYGAEEKSESGGGGAIALKKII